MSELAMDKAMADRVLVSWAKSLPLANQLRKDKEDLLQWVRNRVSSRAELGCEYLLRAVQCQAGGTGDGEWFQEQAESYARDAKHYRELLDWATGWLFKYNPPGILTVAVDGEPNAG